MDIRTPELIIRFHLLWLLRWCTGWKWSAHVLICGCSNKALENLLVQKCHNYIKRQRENHENYLQYLWQGKASSLSKSQTNEKQQQQHELPIIEIFITALGWNSEKLIPTDKCDGRELFTDYWKNDLRNITQPFK